MVFISRPFQAPYLYKPDPNTLLLLHGNDFSDASMYSRAVTNNGAAITQLSGSLNPNVFYFNGSSKINLPIGDYFNFQNGDFTVEWREYLTQYISQKDPFAFDKDPNHFLWYYNGSQISLYYTQEYSGETISTQKLNSWVHRAFVRKSDVLYAFENGALQWTKNANYPTSYTEGYQMCVGGRSDTPQDFLGYMEEFRVSNVARWTSDFTPPTEPYKG